MTPPTQPTASSRLEEAKSRLPPSWRRGLGSLYRRVRYGPGQSVRARAYLKALEEARFEPDLVFYESFYGSSANCSPRALFEYLLEAPDFAHLHHVWSLRNPRSAPAFVKAHPRVRLVRTGSSAHARALANAGTLISNSTLPTWFVRRDAQTYVNTWHGIPLKRMFKHENADRPTVHGNSQRNFLQASRILLPNAFAAETLLGAADVREATRDRTFCLGAPRLDLTLDTDRDALRAELGVRPEQKLVFFAPTWRGELGKVEQSVSMLDDLMADLRTLPSERFAVFGQMHNFMKSPVQTVRPVPEGLPTNRFLAAVDVLITDYSSIMFDVLPTGRQIILYVYDRKDYERQRGFYFDLEEIPAQICYRPQEVISALETGTDSREMPQYAAAAQRFFPHEDGRATERAVAAIFAPATPRAEQPDRSRPRVLFFGGGWKNNGITTSMLNLLEALADYDMDVYVATEGASLEKTQEHVANLQRVPEHVRLLHKAGPIATSRAERAQLERFYRANAVTDAAHGAALQALFRREARRLFGDLDFDAAIDFSGYARYWSLLIAATPARRHAIYQHNDLHSEARKRFDLLNGVFATYRWFDRIVSVSEETRQLNLHNLSQTYPSPDCSVSVANMISPDRIRLQARAPLPEGLALPEGVPLFAMAGRLSPEKAPDRAIQALARLRDDGLDAGLVLMGTGPLQEDLERLIARTGLQDRVVLAGHVENPFSVIARADCFLLSSDYEGQPMVLLEALTLGKPVIATDIAGARGVLGTVYGHLVPADIDGVAAGMRAFLEGQIPADPAFDAEDYCRTALQEFFDRVLGMTPGLREPR